MTKALVSGGYGAGWSSWGDSEKRQSIAEYAPIIEFIEGGGNPAFLDDEHELVIKMMDDLNLDDFYTGGKDNLTVRHVSGSYRIDEYDGNEYITSADELWSN